jgi:hypothetical protein
MLGCFQRYFVVMALAWSQFVWDDLCHMQQWVQNERQFSNEACPTGKMTRKVKIIGGFILSAVGFANTSTFSEV